MVKQTSPPTEPLYQLRLALTERYHPLAGCSDLLRTGTAASGSSCAERHAYLRES